MGPNAAIWSHMGPYGALFVLVYLRPHGANRSEARLVPLRLGTFCMVKLGHMGLYGTVWDPLGLFRAI